MKYFIFSLIILACILALRRRKKRPNPAPAVKVAFPKHWDNPPAIQTKDYTPLPAPYGFGSSTLKKWIIEHRTRDQTGPWSTLVEFEAAYAEEVIEANTVGVEVVRVPHDAMVTQDYRLNRVRVFVDDHNVVVRIPRRG